MKMKLIPALGCSFNNIQNCGCLLSILQGQRLSRVPSSCPPPLLMASCLPHAAIVMAPGLPPTHVPSLVFAFLDFASGCLCWLDFLDSMSSPLHSHQVAGDAVAILYNTYPNVQNKISVNVDILYLVRKLGFFSIESQS